MYKDDAFITGQTFLFLLVKKDNEPLKLPFTTAKPLKTLPKKTINTHPQVSQKKFQKQIYNQRILKQLLRMIHKSKLKSTGNINLHISINSYKLVLNVPKETRVSEVLSMVRSYDKIHEQYGPENGYFIGLASYGKKPIVDYLLTQHQQTFIHFEKELQLKALYTMERKVEALNINQFKFLKCLGKGACGSVYLVRSRVTGYLFALKMLEKSAIRDYQGIKSIFIEQKIMKQLPINPHTVHFHASFESANHFNFLLDYYPGGELFYHLNGEKQLTQSQIKLYFSEILAGIQFLHKNNILYRDLKPQNILVDFNGHLHITDFGLSKCGFRENDNAISHCGSAEYMAPEILQKKQYNFSCDFYSIGAILYEFLTNYPPYYQFEGVRVEQQQKLLMMKEQSLKYKGIKNEHLRNLVKGLLNLNPDERITNCQEIKSNPWLASIDWKKIEDKSTTAPFAPQVNGSYISSEFTELKEEVELLNQYQDDRFQSLGNFDYIRPESRKYLLGKGSSSEPKQQPKQLKDPKRKASGFARDKQHKVSKGNISIALFEQSHSHRERRDDTATTSNSNYSDEPKTAKHIDNKENLFKKESSKKSMLKQTPSTKRIYTAQNSHNVSQCQSKKISKSKEKTIGIRTRNDLTSCKSIINPPQSCRNKSKSKEKSKPNGIGQKQSKKQNISKIKKDILPVSSYKIKLM